MTPANPLMVEFLFTSPDVLVLLLFWEIWVLMDAEISATKHETKTIVNRSAGAHRNRVQTCRAQGLYPKHGVDIWTFRAVEVHIFGVAP